METWKEELKELLKEKPYVETFFYTIKDVKVKLLDYTANPYKAMFEMATQTWGYPGKWERASPRLRFEVVKMILERKALPLALEAPKFSFQINNTSRASFDQISRARIGVTFAARGFKDNLLNNEGFIVPPVSSEDEKLIKRTVLDLKDIYVYLRKKYPGWIARSILPMNMRYNYIISITYLSLQELCSKRMCCIEQPDTVIVAWLLRERVKEKFPLLADYLKPAEIWRNKCVVEDWNGFSEIIGVPHAPCEIGGVEVKSEWDFPCTDVKKLLEELNIKVEWKNYTWEDLENVDRKYFE